MSMRGKNKGPRVGTYIQADPIRLVDEKGEMRGVVPLQEGLDVAKKAGLDLVEVSPNAEPPVCKVLDYGKYKFEAQKKASEAKKKQKTTQLKEVKLRPNIDVHDFEIKMKNVHKFIDAGDKVKITLRFRGREMAHQDLGMQVMDRVLEHIGEKAKADNKPNMEGRQAIMVLSPVK